MINVIYVCYGNICRSVSGEFILKHLVKHSNLEDKFNICSRGISSCETGSDIYYPAKQVLIKNKIPFTRHYAKKIDINDVKNATYILCMEKYHLETIKNMFKNINLDGKIYLLNFFNNSTEDIVDPYYYNNYEDIFDTIYLDSKKFLQFIERKEYVKD